MGKSKKDSSSKAQDRRVELLGRLWVITTKLHGMGELLKGRDGEPPLNQSEVNYGIGEIVTDLAYDLEAVRDQIEKNQ